MFTDERRKAVEEWAIYGFFIFGWVVLIGGSFVYLAWWEFFR